ncbi:hypothetical protein Mal64_28700 [Pseudobythopirellula maris]|uniref:Uncharacterized protein n=1 Tax=Pseudobythopirellula maris TaxID=2527991 RepID=A0A5C5ZIW5_9BACT|nr:hypothetical protein [Pseudobythopirellula maris]TWT87332.1 hypothetical protein Mal64_28700 [Pseudobythopirellula maris]
MPRFTIARAAAICLLAAPACLAHDVLKDPITTHTNGMPLASSQAHRSHSYLWRCDPYHHGFCEGRANVPLLNSLMWRDSSDPGGEAHQQRVGRQSAWGRYDAARSADGLEDTRHEVLGALSEGALGDQGGFTTPTALPASAAPAPAAGSSPWLLGIEALRRQAVELGY